MSKHNNYNKYKNYSSMNDKDVAKAIIKRAEDERKTIEDMTAELESEVEQEEVVMDVEVDVDECAACDATEELPTIDTTGNEPLVGVTTTKLNIRSNPFIAADNIVTVVNEGTVVMIDYPVEDGEWFKIYTEAGIEGYCMKKFVKVSN